MFEDYDFQKLQSIRKKDCVPLFIKFSCYTVHIQVITKKCDFVVDTMNENHDDEQCLNLLIFYDEPTFHISGDVQRTM